MNDLISRQDTLKAISEFGNREYRRKDGTLQDAYKLISALPSAPTVEERPPGEWIWHEDEDICNCSRCDFEIDASGCIDPNEYVEIFNFCPNCGAKMEGSE